MRVRLGVRVVNPKKTNGVNAPAHWTHRGS
jgi:hypothetical protein